MAKPGRAGVSPSVVPVITLSHENPNREDLMQKVRQIADLINPTGCVGLIGVYFDRDRAAWTRMLGMANSYFHLVSFGTMAKLSGKVRHPLKSIMLICATDHGGKSYKPSFIVSRRLPLARAVKASFRSARGG